jgi:hypothetical protein
MSTLEETIVESAQNVAPVSINPVDEYTTLQTLPHKTNNALRRPSMAIKATEKYAALRTILDGYVQADHNILCPACGMKFLYLLDPRDRSDHRHYYPEIRGRMACLRDEIETDHVNGHACVRFAM